MEIIQPGTDVVHEMAALNCCWPPGSLTLEIPE